MQIQSSLDWANVKTALQKEITRNAVVFKHKLQALQMLANIGTQVTKLCDCEMIFRRNPLAANIRTAEEHIEKINTDIHSLEQWLFMLLLSK